jgi:protein associated with RNAse G/E
MFKANKVFKNRILKEVMSYNLQIVIVEDLNFRYCKYLSRQICLRSAFEYAAQMDVDRIVLDRSSSQEKDLITYKKSSRKFPSLPENLHHIASRQEPLLWLPDIFAWSYGAGGLWREKIDHKISHIIRV